MLYNQTVAPLRLSCQSTVKLVPQVPGSIPQVMPTFFNTRWPLLTTLLTEKGWTAAKEGELADLAFVDDGTWRKGNDGSSVCCLNNHTNNLPPPLPTHQQQKRTLPNKVKLNSSLAFTPTSSVTNVRVRLVCAMLVACQTSCHQRI